MRTERRSGPTLALLAVLVSIAASASAEEHRPTVTVRLDAPSHIATGDHLSMVATVTLSPPNRLPLLLTPSSEGTAIEVVRGRLLRADAEEPKANPLVFRIPLVARGPGTAVLRVRVLAYSCHELCRRVSVERTLTLRVLPR